MSLTTTLVQRLKLGNARMHVVDVELVAHTYPAGGVPITPAMVGMSQYYFILPSPGSGFFYEFDMGAKTLLIFKPTYVTSTGAAGDAGADNTVIKVNDTSVGVSGTGAGFIVRSAAVQVPTGEAIAAYTRMIVVGR